MSRRQTRSAAKAATLHEEVKASPPSPAIAPKSKKQRPVPQQAPLFPGFPIGGRCLPFDLEACVYDHLSIGDLAAVFLSSRALSGQIKRYLPSMKRLVCGMDGPGEFDGVFGYQLCVKHFRSLHAIDVKRSGLPFPSGSARTQQQSILAVVDRSHRTLRFVQSPVFSMTALFALGQCQNLESFRTDQFWSSDSWPQPSILSTALLSC